MNIYMLKPSSTDDFFQVFTAHANKITGKPSYDSIRQLRNTVNKNAASINSSAGGGNHGHLGMVMDEATYATIAAVAWVDHMKQLKHPSFQPMPQGHKLAKLTGPMHKRFASAESSKIWTGPYFVKSLRPLNHCI